MDRLTILTRILLLASVLHVSACSALGYIAHTAGGHLALMRKQQPITQLIADQGTDPALRQELRRVVRMRAFAADTLKLPNNRSYTRYVDLQRDYVTWVVFAAPALSLQPSTWCFFIVGCVPYRGYFDIRKAQDFAQQLKAQGLEVYIAPVPAYSTLGWFSDPLLSSMLGRGEVVSAEYIFHELAHQKVYIKNHAEFNEAFAGAVGRLGVMAWLRAQKNPVWLNRYINTIRQKQILYQEVDNLRQALATIYAAPTPNQQAQKDRALAAYTRRVTEKINAWGKFEVYAPWLLENMNNARLNALSTYQALIPEFIRLFERCRQDFVRFYRVVESMQKTAKDRRISRLSSMACS